MSNLIDRITSFVGAMIVAEVLLLAQRKSSSADQYLEHDAKLIKTRYEWRKLQVLLSMDQCQKCCVSRCNNETKRKKHEDRSWIILNPLLNFSECRQTTIDSFSNHDPSRTRTNCFRMFYSVRHDFPSYVDQYSIHIIYILIYYIVVQFDLKLAPEPFSTNHFI